MLVLSAQIFGDGPTLNGDARAQARRDLMRALQLFRQAGDSLGEADGLAALGLDYARFAQYDSARAILRRALDLATVGGASRVQQAGLRLTAAQIERQAGRSPSTIVPALEGVAADARGVVGASVRAKAYFTLAEALANAGRLTESNAALQQAVATQRTRALALTAADREDLGEAFLRLGDVDSARFYLLAADRQDGTANDWRRHALLAQVYRQARPPLFHEAVAHYDSATVAIADRARNAQSDEERIHFADQFAELGRNWVLTWLDRAGRDMDSATVAAASWAAANRVRAPSLVSNLGDLVATIVVPQSDRELADEFERTMRWLGVFGAMPAAVLSYLTTRDTTVVWLGRPGGKMLVARVPVGRDSLAALDAGLRTLIGADTAATRMAPSDDSPAAPARRTATVSEDEDVRAALDRILLPETIRTALPDSGLLLVLPDGATGRVPIAMLRIDAHTQVVDRFAVQLMPSIAALGALAEETGRRRAAPLPSERSVVVGDPQMPTRRTPSGATKVLDSLPEARAEADTIARWLGARALTGPRATAAAVIAALPRAPIVHLATHAVAYGSRDRVGSSYIALAPATRSTRLLASGFLTLDDVMSDAVPRLHADLVMLSACQTALGQLSDSEGIVGFARAFLAKGASSVIVSQWSVNSRASAALSEAFSAHWLRDPDRPSKAEALRRAQRKLRESPEFARARDWASFVLVGAP
jgi:tetratricopeptide (TPR) repeat protein